MKRFRLPRPTLMGMPLFAAVVIALVTIGLTVGARPTAAQMQFDFNGDGEVHCDDFHQQFPDTFTDEATKALKQYPDELSDLNNDPKEDDIACEGQPADADPGDGPGRARDARSTPTPTPAPPAAPAAAPLAAPAAPNSTTASADIPADVMARIEGCAVVAISSHDVTGAGCPGVGTLIFHTPDDAPPLPDTVIMNPGAALQQTAPAASASDHATTNTSKETSTGKSSQGGKADTSSKDNASDTSKANKNTNTDDSKKGKNTKHKGKKDKNNKHNKNDKKSKKHGKKGK